MTKTQTFAILAALSLSATPAAAAPQQAVDPADTIDTVEVTAQREAKRKAIHTYVANVTRFDGEHVARWRFPICPSVAGIAPEHAEFMRARIVEIAEAVGAPPSPRTSLHPSSWSTTPGPATQPSASLPTTSAWWRWHEST